MVIAAEAIPPYLRHARTGPRGAREAALRRLHRTGLPHPKMEDWRYTNLAAIAQKDWRRAPAERNPPSPPSLAGDDACARLVFVNGRHAAAASSNHFPRGLHVSPLDESQVAQDRPFESWHDLNTALFENGLWIRLDAGTVIEKPLEIVFCSTHPAQPSAHHARLLLELGEKARLNIVENHASEPGGAARLVTGITQTRLAAGARLCKAGMFRQETADQALLHESVAIAEAASCDYTLLNFGGGMLRQSLEMVHAGKAASSSLRAFNLADAAHIDLLTLVRHEARETRSGQDIRALARNRGRAVFQGRIHVARDAQKTKARQMHRGLLLSAGAEIDARPGLEIYADDVQCSHGSTCGDLDEEALFYMQSRGIRRDAAEALLVSAFAADLLEEAQDLPLRARLCALLAERLCA